MHVKPILRMQGSSTLTKWSDKDSTSSYAALVPTA